MRPIYLVVEGIALRIPPSETLGTYLTAQSNTIFAALVAAHDLENL
jgi:hypothetical protein